VFGLGAADRVQKLSVIWPDGKPQTWTGLGLDRYHTIVQGESQTREFGSKK
jgi:hypothetical protein